MRSRNRRFGPCWCLAAFLGTFVRPLCAQSDAVPSSFITAQASSEYYPPLTAITLTIDGSGLTGNLHDNHPQGHTMWLSAINGGGASANNPAGLPGPAWILYRFTQPHLLHEIWVWNHNQEFLTDRGLRNVSIHTSNDGLQWTLLGTYELTRAPGTPNYAHGDTLTFPSTRVSQLLLTVSPTNGNYGSAYYGLSEVRFYGEPAPCFPDSYPVRLVSVQPDTSLTQMLAPRPTGWIGSDVAHSIPLSNNTSVWLFGDTLIGTVSGGRRQPGAAFINNSIGIQDRAVDPPDGLQFYWKPGPSSFFPHLPDTPGNFYWPTAGVVLDGELFIFCFSVISGLTVDRTTLLRIPNPTEPPDQWIVHGYDFGPSTEFIIHSAVFVEEPYVYFLGTQSSGFVSYAILARALKADLLAGGLGNVLEYWVNTPQGPAWGPNPVDFVRLFSPGVTETNIQYEPAWDLYIVTTYSPFTPPIYITVAHDLTGPWSEPACIYEIPEHQRVSFDIWSYAVRPHPELSTMPGELVISYATNTPGDLAPLFTVEGLQIYAPKVIRARIEPSGTLGVTGWTLY